MPLLVKNALQDLLKTYTKSQALSLAWLEYFEDRAAFYEAKYQGNFTPAFKMDCACKTCNVYSTFAAHGSVRDFINMHKDHETTTLNRSKRG